VSLVTCTVMVAACVDSPPSRSPPPPQPFGVTAMGPTSSGAKRSSPNRAAADPGAVVRHGTVHYDVTYSNDPSDGDSLLSYDAPAIVTTSGGELSIDLYELPLLQGPLTVSGTAKLSGEMTFPNDEGGKVVCTLTANAALSEDRVDGTLREVLTGYYATPVLEEATFVVTLDPVL